MPKPRNVLHKFLEPSILTNDVRGKKQIHKICTYKKKNPFCNSVLVLTGYFTEYESVLILFALLTHASFITTRLSRSISRSTRE